MLFSFGFTILIFIFIGVFAYYNPTRQEIEPETIHFKNWGD